MRYPEIPYKGKKSWLYMFWFEGTKRRMTLGNYPMMSLADAHEAHATAETKKDKGIDPAAKKVTSNIQSRESHTVQMLTEDYLKATKDQKKTSHEDERVFEKDILPFLGNRKADSIIKNVIIVLLDNIVQRGSPIQANRTLAIIRRVFNWAISRDILLYNPCIGIARPAKPTQRDRMLTEAEIHKLWNNLPKTNMAKSIQLALKLQLVTIQRKGEIVNAERSEINIAEKVWTIPGHKAKNGLTHRVPLSDLAIEIIEEALAVDEKSKWLFISPHSLHQRIRPLNPAQLTMR